MEFQPFNPGEGPFTIDPQVSEESEEFGLAETPGGLRVTMPEALGSAPTMGATTRATRQTLGSTRSAPGGRPTTRPSKTSGKSPALTTVLLVSSDDVGKVPGDGLYCQGIVGRGKKGKSNKCCVKETADCISGTHKSSKHKLQPNTFYIRQAGTPNVILMYPCLALADLEAGDSADDIFAWVKPQEELVSFFHLRSKSTTPSAGAQNLNFDFDEEEDLFVPEDFEDANLEEEASQASNQDDPSTGGTPIKVEPLESVLELKKHIAQASTTLSPTSMLGAVSNEADSGLHEDHYSKSSSQDMVISALVRDLESTTLKQSKVNEGIEEDLENLVTSLEATKDSVTDLGKSVQTDLGLANQASQRLQHQQASYQSTLESLVASKVAEEMAKSQVQQPPAPTSSLDVAAVVAELKRQGLVGNPSVPLTSTKLDRACLNLAQLGNSHQKLSKHTQSSVTALARKVANLESLVGGGAPAGFTPSPGQVPNYATKHDLHQLFTSFQTLQTSLAGFPRLPIDTLQRLTQVEDEVIGLIQQMSKAGSYEFEDTVFKSEADLFNALDKDGSLDSGDIGSSIDLVGCTCRLADYYLTGKEYSDTRRSASQASLTPLAAENMATMSVKAPLFFFEDKPGKKHPVEEDEGWGHQMESFDRYSGIKGKAVRAEINTRARALTATIRGSIIGSGMAQRLDKHLLSEVIRQLGALTTFLTDYYHELVNECNYPSKVAWSYLGVLTRAIIKFLVGPRVEVASLGDVTSKAGRVTVLFAVLEVHRRMNSLIDCDFKSHPVMITTMNTFVMKHRIDASELAAVGSKCDLVTKSSSLVDRRVAVLEALSKTVTSDIKFLKGKK